MKAFEILGVNKDMSFGLIKMETTFTRINVSKPPAFITFDIKDEELKRLAKWILENL